MLISFFKRTFFRHPVIFAFVLSGWVYGGFLAAQIVVALLLPAVLLQSPAEVLGESQYVLITSALIYVVSLLFVVGIPALNGAWSSGREFAQLLGIHKAPNWRQLLWSPVAYVAYFSLTVLVIMTISQLFPGFNVSEQQDVGFSNLNLTHEYIAAFVALVICAPIAEELLFRGFLFGKLRNRLAFIPSSLTVSVLFGFVHGQWNVAIDTFFLSVALCYLREKSGALWPSILLHIIKNAVAYYFLFVHPGGIV